MTCQERSPVKLDEANLYTKGLWEFPCYEEVEGMLEYCGQDLFEPLFELYRSRLLSGHMKAPGYTRLQMHVDAYGTAEDRKVMHF